MRLLECIDGDGFVLTKDLIGDDNIPPYAILSHTWKDGEEVTFNDLVGGSGKSKTGYDKIRFCGQQAKCDGLRYFWVDTCCINKSDQVELQDAINSMYRWYEDAANCYVYLSDVSTTKRKAIDEFTWEQAFQESRWFTRGWTLQELLAPRSVEFFSREGKRLGDKSTLEREIHKITSIPIPALQGARLREFDVEERLSWTTNRRTARKEDKAYSLLGIFGIYMPLLYGEGEENAFKRLREEIDKTSRALPARALPAQHASTTLNKEDQMCIKDLRLTDPRDDKKRIEETKGGLLADSYRWILDNSDFQRWRDGQQNRLLWIKGDPGKGKTMLLCGIIDELKRSKTNTDLLSYFFCQATDTRINNATAVLRGLLYLLVDQQPQFLLHIRKKYDHAGKTLFEDANAWVALCEIFTNILQDPSLNNVYLVVDALDECVVDLSKLLHFIVQKSSESSRIKWIVSGRNWPDIERDLNTATQKIRLCLELNEKSVSAAVDTYVQFKVNWLAERNRYNNATREYVQRYLSLNANGTFLWVALVCQELENVSGYKTRRKLKLFPPGLDGLYRRMLDQICSEDAGLCKRILAVVSVVYRPITWDELTSFVEIPDGVSGDCEAETEIIGICGSFLTLRKRTVFFVHQSVKDFLLGKASKDIFSPTIEDIHYTIFSRSLRVMSKTLRRDVYGLHAPGFPIDRVIQPDPDPLATVRYSCVYWIHHLRDCIPHKDVNDDIQEGGSIDSFIRQHYLHWLEALSLCKCMSEGIASIAELESLIEGRARSSALNKLVRDARRFLMYHKWPIENNPLQVYASALVFSPARSLIRGLFTSEEPRWIQTKPAVKDEWTACLQTLEGHRNWVLSVIFSPDSTRLASASWDRTVKIWDASSGECLQTLEGHSDEVWSVIFSPDSTQLASASSDRTVKIWDASSGECMQTLEGHNNSVRSVAFSPDSTRLASATDDSIVKIWDASSGECLQTLKGHSNMVWSVTFSPDSTRLASASSDRTVKIWDANSGECMQTLKSYSSSVRSVAFSPDSTRLASASWDRTVKIWDASSGECLQTLEGHNNSVRSVIFSPDSSRLASASSDRTVKIWDACSGECLQTLEGHSEEVWSVIFSSDSTRLASASGDQTIKIWDTSSGEHPQMLEGHSNVVWSVTFSPDSTRLASASWDGTVKIWDASSGECLQTLEGHSSSVMSVTFSPDSSRLASASDDRTVKVWDASSGEYLQTLEGHSDSVWKVAFSPDSTQLASASKDETVKIWDTSNGECLKTLKGHSDWVFSIAFSSNSTRLASASRDSTVKIWDASSGENLQTLEGHDDESSIWSLAFSSDSTRLVSASDDMTVKIWDVSSGECLQTLNVGRSLYEVSFDTTSPHLHTEIGTIVIDSPSATPDQSSLAYMTGSQNLKHTGVALSVDGMWITFNSENLLWLPSEYRPDRSAVSGNTIGIGTRSGKVWTCPLNLTYL